MSVNDAFVMDAWGKSQGATGKIRMLADTSGEFTKVYSCSSNCKLCRNHHAHSFLLCRLLILVSTVGLFLGDLGPKGQFICLFVIPCSAKGILC